MHRMSKNTRKTLMNFILFESEKQRILFMVLPRVVYTLKALSLSSTTILLSAKLNFQDSLLSWNEIRHAPTKEKSAKERKRKS
jgi:hypothetical protein